MDDGTEERWLPVVGWEDLYEVSDQGRVFSRRSGRILKPRPSHDGYLRAQLCSGGSRSDRYIQNLVAEAFLGPRPEGCETLHGPGGITDNRLVNLSYGTHLDNCDDRTRDGRYHFKLTQAMAAEIRAKFSQGQAIKSLAADYRVNKSTIARILNGTRWAAGTGEAFQLRRPNATAAEIEEMRVAWEAGKPTLEIAEHVGVSLAHGLLPRLNGGMGPERPQARATCCRLSGPR